MEYLNAMQIILSRLNNEHKYEPIIEPIDQLKNDEEKEDKLFHYFRYDILTKAENNDGYYEIKVNVNPIKFIGPVIIRYALTESLIQRPAPESIRKAVERTIANPLYKENVTRLSESMNHRDAKTICFEYIKQSF